MAATAPRRADTAAFAIGLLTVIAARFAAPVACTARCWACAAARTVCWAVLAERAPCFLCGYLLLLLPNKLPPLFHGVGCLVLCRSGILMEATLLPLALAVDLTRREGVPRLDLERIPLRATLRRYGAVNSFSCLDPRRGRTVLRNIRCCRGIGNGTVQGRRWRIRAAFHDSAPNFLFSWFCDTLPEKERVKHETNPPM